MTESFNDDGSCHDRQQEPNYTRKTKNCDINGSPSSIYNKETDSNERERESKNKNKYDNERLTTQSIINHGSCHDRQQKQLDSMSTIYNVYYITYYDV